MSPAKAAQAQVADAPLEAARAALEALSGRRLLDVEAMDKAGEQPPELVLLEDLPEELLIAEQADENGERAIYAYGEDGNPVPIGHVDRSGWAHGPAPEASGDGPEPGDGDAEIANRAGALWAWSSLVGERILEQELGARYVEDPTQLVDLPKGFGWSKQGEDGWRDVEFVDALGEDHGLVGRIDPGGYAVALDPDDLEEIEDVAAALEAQRKAEDLAASEQAMEEIGGVFVSEVSRDLLQEPWFRQAMIGLGMLNAAAAKARAAGIKLKVAYTIEPGK